MTTPHDRQHQTFGHGNPTHTVQPYYVRDRQDWAIDQEHLRHNQALWTVGEYAMFALMWHIQDFTAGLVGRCQKCYKSHGVVAEAYGQGSKNKCTSCYGTTFEGGFKNLIVRPAIFADTDSGEMHDRRGMMHPDDVDVESTSDFRVRPGDYVFRADGTRWQLRVPQRVTLRTGFGFPGQAQTGIGYNLSRASLEDVDSVAYLIPPRTADLAPVLRSGQYVPANFAAVEVMRGPLIPANDGP